VPLADQPPPYATVVFDCDSTLSAMEGIEALAGAEHADTIAAMTDAAMAGEVALEEVFGRRLELVRPSRDDLAEVGRRYVEALVPGADLLVRALRSLGKRVVVVSGGLLPAVRVLADALGVDETHAVDVRFGEDGGYAGFDDASPLARTGGKIDVLTELAGRSGAGPLAFVGDGATDLEAGHLAARFVAYGGVVRRERVFAGAAVTCDSSDFRDLAPLLLSADELEALRAVPTLAPLNPSD
jgi:phosphoserine phosphatase